MASPTIGDTNTDEPGTAGARLTSLTPGQPVVFGGDRVVHVSDELAAAFAAGDQLIVDPSSGSLLHVPEREHAIAAAAVTAAVDAFGELARCTDDQITRFFETFADRLDDDEAFAAIAAANAADVESARARGRSTTRLELSSKMRADMASGLRGWAAAPLRRDNLDRTVEHAGWSVELRRAPLGAVGFVFEGRPNVFARRGRRGANRQHGRVPNRFRRARHRRGDRRTRAATGARRVRASGWHDQLGVVGRARGRLGVVLRRPTLARRRPRLGAGGRPARRGGAAGGGRGQPARNGRRLGGGCARRRHRSVRGDGPPFARPQGVQHAQHVLHRAQPCRRSGPGVRRSGRCRIRCPGDRRSHPRDRDGVAVPRYRRDRPTLRRRPRRRSPRRAVRFRDRARSTRARMGVGGIARGHAARRR